jgi:hypothetical protein
MKLCAYHSNLYFDSFRSHVKEIKGKGFDTLLFAISETDMLFNLQIFKEFKDFAETEGLRVWATYWGLTAGEAVCKHNDLRQWLAAIRHIGITDVMIDEPKDKSSIELFFTYAAYFNFHLCLTDDTFNKMSDDDLVKMPVASVGVSCYHWVKDWVKIIGRSEAIAKRLNNLRPDNNFIFLQGFDIPEGWEDIPMKVKSICESNGIVNFGVWSFRATVTGTKRSANPGKIWDNITFI